MHRGTATEKDFIICATEYAEPVTVLSEVHLTIQPLGRRVNVPVGESIYSVARSAGVASEAFCGGRGLCGKCRIVVREGRELLSGLTDSEVKFLSKTEIRDGYRLACETIVKGPGDLAVEIPRESQVRRQRLSVLGIERKTRPRPSISKYTVRVSQPSLEDVTADLERLLAALNFTHGISDVSVNHDALKRLPETLRRMDWTVTVSVKDGREIIDVEPDDTTENCYGFAVDIGTTKLAGYLVNLKDGSVTATSSMMNPQIPYGEDVISRISYVMKDRNKLAELQSTVIGGLNKLLSDALKTAKIERELVYDVVVVGNTAMHHIFFGITPDFVSLSPYPAALQSPLSVRSKEVGLEANTGAYVYSYPIIAGFVGADAVADIVATGIFEAKETSLLIDIGTNTEIVLGNHESLISCSTASGPAFEGAHIKHGMRAATGAIEKIWIEPDTFEPSCRVIDETKPEGICGSGIVDALAEMFRVGILDETGKMNLELNTPRLKSDGEPRYVLAKADETANGKEMAVTQHDVNEIQLAKSAIFSGTSIVMKRFGVERNDIAKVYLAGAFGTYVDPESARMIGMLPDVPTDRFEFAGNTAGSGARMALISTEIRDIARSIVKKTKYLELAKESDFQDEFMKALYFPHKEIERFPTIAKLIRAKQE